MSVWDTAALRAGYVDKVASQLNWRLAGILAFTAVTLILLSLVDDIMRPIFWTPNILRLALPFLAAVAVAAFFVGARYNEFTPLLSATMRASIAGLLAVLVLEPLDYTLANPDQLPNFNYLRYAYPAAVICALIGVFRPSFAIPAAIYLISSRMMVSGISGIEMSFLDIRYTIDMALYTAVFGLFVVKLGPKIHPWLASKDRQNEIVGAAFGLHLANYFWSGIAKVAIGPTPWYWIFENKTYNQIPQAIEAGILPIGHIPWLSQLAYDLFKLTYIPLNLIIVAVQIFAVLCVLKISWLKITSVLFDCLHIGIYVLGGLFFWPWIWNNLTIWWGARSQKQGLSFNTKVACIATIGLGAPVLHLNEAAWLAWYDVADSRHVFIEAVTKDGEGIKAPNAFFTGHSYSISHAYMGNQPEANQYDFTQLGSSHVLAANRTSGSCPTPLSVALPASEPPEARAARLGNLERFLKANHAKMLAREDTFGRGSYYWRFHHHPSNPFLYDKFNKLSLHDVVGYRLVIESRCLTMDHGKVVKKAWPRMAEYFSVE